jgi:hypothetical protein
MGWFNWQPSNPITRNLDIEQLGPVISQNQLANADFDANLPITGCAKE